MSSKESGYQSVKSLIGIFVFIAFIIVSSFFNNRSLPFSQQIAFATGGGSGSGSGAGGGGGGGGGFSNYTSAITGGTVDASINSFSITEVGKNYVFFTWSTTNVSSVKLYAGEDTGVPKEVAFFTTETSYRLNNLKENTTYYFYLEARSPLDKLTKTSTLNAKTGVPINAPQTVVTVSQPTADRNSLIANLRQQIAQLLTLVLDLIQKQVVTGKKVSPEAQKQLASLTNISAPISDDLPPVSKRGDRGINVRQLQQKLIGLNIGSRARKLSLFGASGYYGNATTEAVIELQEALLSNPNIAGFSEIKDLRTAIEIDFWGGWGPATIAAQKAYLKIGRAHV